jgi:DNA-binding response OmpR family regulator
VSLPPRVLVIDGSRESLAALGKALAASGLTNVTGVASGSFALTMLERDRPDLIVCRADVPDIDGWELCGIVRSDPSMRGVLFLLLAGVGDVPDGGIDAGPDRMLVGEFSPATIVAEVQSLLSEGRAPAPPRAPGHAPHGLRGSLAVIDLPDLAQAIALGAKTGNLLLTLEAGEGSVLFDRGRVVHAEFGALTGERAFAALVATAHREGRGTFAFDPLESLGPGRPRTIERSVKQLLLSIAAEIDEGRAASTTAAPTEPKARRE